MWKRIRPVVWILPFVMVCAAVFSGCRNSGPLEGVELLQRGVFHDISDGRLYIPASWNPETAVTIPVTVILHGYSSTERSISEMPFWKNLAEEKPMVLFLVRSEKVGMGWSEAHDSADSRRIIAVLKAFRRKPWLADTGLCLFGWSAGAVVATGFTSRNVPGPGNKPLFDSLVSYSGFIGYQFEKDLKKDPELRKVARVPVFFCWGEQEPSGPPQKACDVFRSLGFTVRTATHPSGHYLMENIVRKAFE